MAGDVWLGTLFGSDCMQYPFVTAGSLQETLTNALREHPTDRVFSFVFDRKEYLMKSLHWLARFGGIDLVALITTNDYLLTMDMMKIL